MNRYSSTILIVFKGLGVILSAVGLFLLLFQPLVILEGYTDTKSELISPQGGGGTQSMNIWYPDYSKHSVDNQDLDLTATSVLFADINTGQIMYQKNAQEKRSVASLVKIMTAIVTLENKKWEDWMSVSSKAAGMEPDHMILKEGEKLKVGELMSGLFLISANDASEVMAENSFGGREKFISEMNRKAKLLGMNNTFFINPSGLDEDGKDQFSTALDVLLMSRFAIKNFPELINITSNPYIYLGPTDTHQSYDLYSGINLVTTYPGVLGFKTGFTPKAGMTLVTYAKKGNHEVVGIILDSENRRDEARILLDYSFQKLEAY